MNLDHLGGLAAWLFIFFAAAIEGEVVLVAASVLVGLGRLSPLLVLTSGALGGSAGDHFYYLAARGWLQRFMHRLPISLRRREAMLAKVRLHGARMAFACRFLPGVRIAVAVSCAAAGVKVIRFSLANLAAGFIWAAAVMSFVAWGGPQWLGHLGLPRWSTWVIPAAFVVLFVWWLTRVDKRHLEMCEQSAA